MRIICWLPISFTALLCSCPAPSPTPRVPRAEPASSPKDRDVARPASVPASRPAPKPALFWADALEARRKEAEEKASPVGQAVLAAAREMIDKDVVVRGSCWDYANAVYTRAGFKGWRRQMTPYRSRTRGPYADPKRVQAGDWLYIINHPPTLATHSLIFVHWTDFAKRQAMTITYVGDNRDQGGYYRTYDLSRIYQIIRPKPPQSPER